MTWNQMVSVHVGAVRILDRSQVSHQTQAPATAAVFDQENPLAVLLAHPTTRAYLVERALGGLGKLPEPAEAILARLVASKTRPARAFTIVRGKLPPGSI
jgi:hypothetical protein